MKRDRKPWRAASWALALMILSGGTAFGWGQTWAGIGLEKLVNAARAKIGLVRYNLAFRLDNAGYDSDLFYGYLPEAVPDITFSVGPSLHLMIPIEDRVVIDVSDVPQYVFYQKTESERALNNVFRGHVHFVFDRVYIQAGGGLSNVRERLSPELNVHIRRKENVLDGAVLWQASSKTSFALGYSGAKLIFEDSVLDGIAVGQNLNRKQAFIDLIAYFQRSARTRLYLNAEYGSYAFTEEVSKIRDTRSYSFFGGFEFLANTEKVGETKGAQGRINLGYKQFDVIDPAQKDARGLVGNTNVSVGIFKKTVLRGFFTRDFQFSAYAGEPYYTQTSYGGGLTRQLTRKIAFSYDLTFGRNPYPEDGEAAEPRNIVNRYTTHQLNLDIRLGPVLSVALLGNLSSRTLNENDPSKKRFFVGFSLVYGYVTASSFLLDSPWR